MLVVVRRVAALLGLALLCATLTSCTNADRVTIVNDTNHWLSFRWGPTELGSLDPHRSAEISLDYSFKCWDGAVRAVSADSAVAVLLDPDRFCPDSRVVVHEADLAPATATMTIVNTTGAPADLSFLTGTQVSAAPDEEVRVALEVPAGQCLPIPSHPRPGERPGGAPSFWGTDVCDGDVEPLALVGPPAVTLDNRTGVDLSVVDGVAVLGAVPAGTRVEVVLPEEDCLLDRVRMVSADRRRVVSLAEVCPAGLVVVDHLDPTAAALVTNDTDETKAITLAGPALTATQITLEPGRSRQVLLDSPAGTCVDVTATTETSGLNEWAWSGYLCDRATLTARTDAQQAGGGATWRTSW